MKNSRFATLASAANPVIDALRDSGHADLANDLLACIERINAASLDPSWDSVERVVGLCSIKALGDVHIGTLSSSEWLQSLSKLRKSASEILAGRGKN